jgi:hypothetical protein
VSSASRATDPNSHTPVGVMVPQISPSGYEQTKSTSLNGGSFAAES